MKIQVMSDLHLEFGAFDIPATDADVILLAGDIHVGVKAIDWIKKQSDKPVIYVLGNHVYYGQKFPDLQEKIREECEGTNIHFLEKESVNIDGVRFLGCTLWTDFELFDSQQSSMYEAELCMNDFRKIKAHIDGQWRKLKPFDCLKDHQESREWLAHELQDTSLPTVVVTHHAPSNQSNAARFKSSSLAPAFASKLETFIEKHQPELWIHGHMHNSSDYRLGKTRVLCNPRGYFGIEKNRSFDPEFTVEIEEEIIKMEED